MTVRASFAAVISAFMCVTAHAMSYTWTGGGAAGNWNDSANWSPNGVPNAGDDAKFELAGDLTITSDIAISSGFLTINNCGAVVSLNGVVSGEGGIKLIGTNYVALAGNNTFKGGVQRNSFLSGVQLYHDHGLGTGPFTACDGAAANTGNAGRTPLQLLGASAMTVTNDMTFGHESFVSWNGSIYSWCDATLTGNISFNGQTRMAVSNPGTFMRYKGRVTGASDKLLVMNTAKHIYYEKPIEGGCTLFCDGGNAPKVHLCAAGNNFNSISVTGTSRPVYYLEAVDAMNGKSISFKSPNGTIDLCGNDQTVEALYDNAWVGNNHCVTSSAPATLTLKPTSNYRFGGRFLGAVSIVFAPASSARTYLVSNSVSTATGSITVSNGTFQIKSSSFMNLLGVTVAPGAKFQVMDAGSRLSPDGFLDLGDATAKISLPSGCRILTLGVTVGGNLLPQGIYAARASAPEGTIPVDWIEGEGLVECVQPAGMVVWTGDGGSETWRRPVASLGGALACIRNARADHPGGEWRVELAEGDFYVEEPVVFTPADSGAPGSPLRIVGAGMGRTRILGAKRLAGFTAGSDGRWTASIPRGADGTPLWFESLFVNGRRAVRARHPNIGLFTPADVSQVVITNSSNNVYAEARLMGRAEDVAAVAATPDGYWRYAQLIVHHNWNTTRRIILGFDPEDCAFLTQGKELGSSNPWSKSSLYYVENLPAALDEPGEWFYDAPNGRILYIPREGESVDDAEVLYPVPGLKSLVLFEGGSSGADSVHDVEIEGVSFLYSDSPRRRGPLAAAYLPVEVTGDIDRLGPTQVDPAQAASWAEAAVCLDGAERVVFRSCEMSHVGEYALWFRNACRDNALESCLVSDLGAGGVRIGLTSRSGAVEGEHVDALKPGETGRNRIHDCIIARGGRLHASGVGVWIGSSPFNSVTHCEISDFLYTGVSIGWTWGYGGSRAQQNTLAFCRIRNIGQKALGDMGGVYTLGTSFGTCVSNNVICNVDSYTYGGWGLYTDEGSEGIVMENNLVHDTKDGSFHQNYGRDNIIRNNILAYSRQGQVAVTRPEAHRSMTMERNIIFWDKGRTFVGKVGTLQETAIIDWIGNIWWKTDEPVEFNGKTFAQWQAKGNDVDGMVADPLFEDTPARDFRLKSASPAPAAGFRPFDASAAGVCGDAEWRALAESLGDVASYATLYTWTGKGAAGNWNDPANWSPNGVPNAGDAAKFVQDADLAITSGISIASGFLTINNCGAVVSLNGVVSGEGGIKLIGTNYVALAGNNTFKGGVQRNSFLSGAQLYHDHGLGTGPFTACDGAAANSGNVGHTPLQLLGTSAMTVTNDMTFGRESFVSWNGSIYSWCDATLTGNIHFKDQTRIVVSSPGAFMRFKGGVKGSGSRLLVMNTTKHIYYEKPIDGGQLYCDSANAPKVHLLASSNTFNGISVTGSSRPVYYLEAVDAMNGRSISFKSPNGTIDLCGNDQTVDAVYDNDWVGNNHCVTSGAPAALTLKPTSDCRFGGRFLGAVSIVFAPASQERIYLVSNSVSTTTGSITVSNGTFQIKSSSFPNLSGITVAPGAKFEVLDAVSALNTTFPLALGDETAKLSLPAGYRLLASGVTLGGEPLPQGTYAARTSAPTGTTPVDWIEGEGQVVSIPSAGTIVWTGAGGNSLASNPANWAGLSAPPDFSQGNLVAVFPAGAAAFTATFPAGISRVMGIVVGATNFTFAAADASSALGVGAGGIVYDRIEGVSRTITYNVSVAPAYFQEWAADDAETESSLKIVMNRPLADDSLGIGNVTISGGGRYDLYTTNSTYTGDIKIDRPVPGGIVNAYGNEPFGPSGTLCVVAHTYNGPSLRLNDVVTSKTVIERNDSNNRCAIAWNAGLTVFKGLVASEGVDGCAPNGTIVFEGGYGDSQHSGTYLNWGSASVTWGSGAKVIITNKPFHVGTIQADIRSLHLYAPSNNFNLINGWHQTYSPYSMTANIHFHTNFAFHSAASGCSVTGNSVWDFHGTEQTIGFLNGYSGFSGGMISTNGPGRLNVRQSSGWASGRSATGFQDFWYDGRFKGEMSLGLTGTRRLILRQDSTATGCVEVAESATLCFTNNASWASATNVAVRANGRIEAWNGSVLGRRTDLTLADSGVYEFCGAGPYVQKVRYLWLDGRRRTTGDFDSTNSGGRIVGNGVIRVLGDGSDMVVTFR